MQTTELGKTITVLLMKPGATAAIREIAAQSPRHETFMARKLMLMDIRLNPEACRELVAKPALREAAAKTWFPLDNPEKTDERVHTVVKTIHLWYRGMTDTLIQDLNQIEPTERSWVWYALAGSLIHEGRAKETESHMLKRTTGGHLRKHRVLQPGAVGEAEHDKELAVPPSVQAQ